MNEELIKRGRWQRCSFFISSVFNQFLCEYITNSSIIMRRLYSASTNLTWHEHYFTLFLPSAWSCFVFLGTQQLPPDPAQRITIARKLKYRGIIYFFILIKSVYNKIIPGRHRCAFLSSVFKAFQNHPNHSGRRPNPKNCNPFWWRAHLTKDGVFLEHKSLFEKLHQRLQFLAHSSLQQNNNWLFPDGNLYYVW